MLLLVWPCLLLLRHYILHWSITVNLRLLKAVDFVVDVVDVVVVVIVVVVNVVFVGLLVVNSHIIFSCGQ